MQTVYIYINYIVSTTTSHFKIALIRLTSDPMGIQRGGVENNYDVLVEHQKFEKYSLYILIGI